MQPVAAAATNAAADRSAAEDVQSRRADTDGASVTGKNFFESVMRFTLRSFSDEFNARCSRDGYRKGAGVNAANWIRSRGGAAVGGSRQGEATVQLATKSELAVYPVSCPRAIYMKRRDFLLFAGVAA